MIGVIRTPFHSPEGVPIQPAAAQGIVGRVEMDRGVVDGLKDLDGFSHVILIYHFHEAKAACLRVKPYMDGVARGVFATRSPARPNAIGVSVVRLLGIEGNIQWGEMFPRAFGSCRPSSTFGTAAARRRRLRAGGRASSL